MRICRKVDARQDPEPVSYCESPAIQYSTLAVVPVPGSERRDRAATNTVPDWANPGHCKARPSHGWACLSVSRRTLSGLLVYLAPNEVLIFSEIGEPLRNSDGGFQASTVTPSAYPTS